jgi:hypothetical protein
MQDHHEQLLKSDDNSRQYWAELQKKFPSLNVYEQYQQAFDKLGRHPNKSYFDQWLEIAAHDILPFPPDGKMPKRWIPPTKEQVMAYCEENRWQHGFGSHAWSVFIASNWKHYGETIKSEEQWKAIMNVMEWHP